MGEWVLTHSASLLQEDEQLLQHKGSKEHDTVMHQLDEASDHEGLAMLSPHGFPHSALRCSHQVGCPAQCSLKGLHFRSWAWSHSGIATSAVCNRHQQHG